MDRNKPSFTRDGKYDLSTRPKRLAAAEAMLRVIAMIPQAYHARGPEFCRNEMARIAAEGARLLEDARMPRERYCDACGEPADAHGCRYCDLSHPGFEVRS